MEITWFGHSCFLLKSKTGKKVLTDPYDKSVGYPLPNESVDIVTVSHHHFDHNFTESLPGIPTIVDKIGNYNFPDINIKGIGSFHDKDFGAKRGDNIIFLINIDGFNICHLGDLGHIPTSEMLTEIGPVDVLMIPVGGNYTIDGEEAATITKIVDSYIVLPMHYSTDALTFLLDGVEKFIIKMGNSYKVDCCTLELTDLPDIKNRVKILKYKSES
jgi:L-ascorbate metabolism protein UlaG (beta-lactamase superfamily)